MKSMPAASARRASLRQSVQLADQRSGTLVAERPDEQLAPNSPILSALPLYMAMRLPMDALRASTACSPRWPIIIAMMATAIKRRTVYNLALEMLVAAEAAHALQSP